MQNEKHRYRTLKMLRKLTNEEIEKIMVGPGYGEKYGKTCKMRNTLQDLENGGCGLW
jgi:hypothetical protein